MDVRRLYKSDTDKMICGVCGGIGEFLNVIQRWCGFYGRS